MDNYPEKDITYKKADKILNKIISTNLQALIEARGLSQAQFIRELSKSKISITRSYWNKLLNHPETSHISAAFALSCCDFFGISLHNLVSTDFDTEEYIYNDTPAHKEYLNIKALIAEKEKEHTRSSFVEQTLAKNANFLSPFDHSSLVTDPTNALFSGYIQDYYCYYYPTHSSENKNAENILKGILHLEKSDIYCKATLTIDTKTADDFGQTNYKQYDGYAAISPTVNSLTCIMYSDSLCEFCFLMFRYFKLNFGKQDCRIAEVLSSSSADESRRPTVLRMLLSKQEITESDLKLVSPALFLNYSTIAITEDNLKKIGNFSEKYNQIIKDVLQDTKPQAVYFCKEDNVSAVAQRYLTSKEEIAEFLMHLRSLSYSYRYNKVSPKVDTSVRRILLSKGYFKKSPTLKKGSPQNFN